MTLSVWGSRYRSSALNPWVSLCTWKTVLQLNREVDFQDLLTKWLAVNDDPQWQAYIWFLVMLTLIWWPLVLCSKASCNIQTKSLTWMCSLLRSALLVTWLPDLKGSEQNPHLEFHSGIGMCEFHLCLFTGVQDSSNGTRFLCGHYFRALYDDPLTSICLIFCEATVWSDGLYSRTFYLLIEAKL